MPKLTIDGIQVSVAPGKTILDAAKYAGVKVPTLCFLENINAIGSCRVCAVEIEGQEALVPACNTLAADGMVVTTSSARVRNHRKTVLQLLLAEHGLDSTNYCFSCA